MKDTAESLTASVAETANRMRTIETEASEDQALAKEVYLEIYCISFSKRTTSYGIFLICVTGIGKS